MNLNEILENHKLWLENKGGIRANLRDADLHCADLQGADLRDADLHGADLRGADLRSANLRGADLQDAYLDFSCMPLWCGDLKAHYDDKQIIQQLYHVLSHVKYSKNASPKLKKALLKGKNIKIANKFHLIGECGEL